MIEKPNLNYISQADLVEVIVAVLTALGHRAPKTTVEKEVFDRHHCEFAHPYYQEYVAGGVPRWRHYIAWAKEQAKHQGLIKRPQQSGYGIWELLEVPSA
jgi:hypothetical protein